MYNTITIVLV